MQLLPSCVQTPSRLMMFLCLSITFISSISEMRSARSLSVASSEGGENDLSFKPAYFSLRQQTNYLSLYIPSGYFLHLCHFFPTFEHFNRHSGGLVWAVLVDAVGLGSNHLTKAAFSQRFA